VSVSVSVAVAAQDGRARTTQDGRARTKTARKRVVGPWRPIERAVLDVSAE
jgi:hypothetical protein